RIGAKNPAILSSEGNGIRTQGGDVEMEGLFGHGDDAGICEPVILTKESAAYPYQGAAIGHGPFEILTHAHG
ncbi:MAG: hypothetical protein ACI87O_000585, partial [Planctomycetota bacterium]